MTPPAPDPIGQRLSQTHPTKDEASLVDLIPDHELLQRIGGGAYGEVWLARNVLGESRAVKIIHRNRFSDPRPFEREFEGIQRFEPISRSHPSQLAILHVGKNDAAGCFYYVMELADETEPGPSTVGRVTPCAPTEHRETGAQGTTRPTFADSPPYQPHTLRHDLEQQTRLPAARVLELGVALAEALVNLHSHGLVHRDVKPSNIIFVNGRPKLADIGLVTDASDQCSIVGTEGYIAPEGPGKPPADIFALGKVLYEALTGMDRRRYPEIPAAVRDWPDRKCVFELNEVILRACSGDARHRYANARMLLADLQYLLRGRSVKRRRVVRHATTATLWFGGLVAALATLMWGVSSKVDKVKSAELYRRARAVTILDNDRFNEAVRLFDEAIAYDPDYAPSHSGLANAYMQVAGWLRDPRAARVEIKRSVTTALKLDPDDREGLVVMGCVRMDERDWAGAEIDFKRVLAVHPRYVRGQFYCAYFLRVAGRMTEARALTDQALGAQPENSLLRWGAYYQSCAERQFERAIREVRQSMGDDTNKWSSAEFLVAGWAATHLGRHEEAIGFLEAAVGRVDAAWTAAPLAWALAKGGQRAKAIELTVSMERGFRATGIGAPNLALAYMGLGEHDHALGWLQRAIAMGWCGEMLHLLSSPVWDEVRADAHFQALERELHLPSLSGR